ncbi:unnamed protein product, partial [Urochloa humidicola]
TLLFFPVPFDQPRDSHTIDHATRNTHSLPRQPRAAESANPSTSRHRPAPAIRPPPAAIPPLSAVPTATAMSMQSISPAAVSAQFTYPAAAAAAVAATTPSYFPVPFHLQNPQYAAWPAATAATPAVAPVPAYNAVYPMPHVQQAQQLFQKDSKIISPEALATVKAAIANSEKDRKVDATKKAVPRKAAGQSWEDPTLADWPENDFRLFCGDLGNEVNDDVLTKVFSKYPSFNMARVIRDKWTGKTKGYGFVSFANASDLAAALKEMNGKYVGNRPIKLRKSTWKNRIDFEALERGKIQPQKKVKLQKRSVLHK